MARPRPKVGQRQFTLYFRSVEDKKRWRELSKPYTLNKWILLTVEKALESPAPSRTKTTDDINALRKEVVDLRKENESLAARLDQIRAREVEDILERSSNTPMRMDKHVVDLLRSGGYWSSTRLIKKLAQEAAPPEGMHAFAMEENNSITADFFSNINDNLTLDVKAVERTLDALEQIGLVKKTWQGWKWDNI
jgi:23S rRNA pseudoU1915 N3-methylase RlmH